MSEQGSLAAFRLPKKLLAELRAAAKIEDRSISAIIRLAIARYLENRKANLS